MATSIFIDPLNGTDAVGKGAIGDPYKSTVYALNNHTYVNAPIYINIRNTAADVLTEDLCTSLKAFHTNNSIVNTATRQVIFRGYDTTENDGGRGILDGNASYSIYYDDRSNSNCYYTHFLDLEMRNSGANGLMRTYYYSNIVRCVIHGCTYTYGVETYPYSNVTDCYFYDCDCYYVIYGHNISGCFFYSIGGMSTYYAMRVRNAAYNNIVVNDESDARGIHGYLDCELSNNTIIATGNSSGYGIYFDGYRGTAYNNIIAGFSNSGTGIYGANKMYMYSVLNNSFYNCTTDINTAVVMNFNTANTGNETIASDPIARLGDPTYENRFEYFQPLDVGSVWGGSLPAGSRRDRGAVQHKDNVYVVF